jgi:hypothetical protein
VYVGKHRKRENIIGENGDNVLVECGAGGSTHRKGKAVKINTHMFPRTIVAFSYVSLHWLGILTTILYVE